MIQWTDVRPRSDDNNMVVGTRGDCVSFECAGLADDSLTGEEDIH